MNEQFNKMAYDFEMELDLMGNKSRDARLVGMLLAYAFRELHVKNLVSKVNEVSYEYIIHLIDDDIKEMFCKYIDEETWETNKQYCGKYSQAFYEYAILNDKLGYVPNDAKEATPESIIQLAIALLGDMNNKKVCDVCCGTGNFLVNSIRSNMNAKFYGIDIDSHACEVLKIKNNILNHAISEIETKDVLTSNPFHGEKFDFIFANYPFGVMGENINSFVENHPEYSGLRKRTSDWVFNSQIVEMLKEDGKAVVLMSGGSINNMADRVIKEYYVENNLIETVIKLPVDMFKSTDVSVVMVVLNKNKKVDTINMIDASNIYQKDYSNYFSSENIKEITSLISKKSEISEVITNEEVLKQNGNLDVKKYIDKPVVYENGVALEVLMKSISRGAPLKASQLEKLKVDYKTEYQYLMIGNIDSGIVDEELSYLSSFDESFERYCVKDNNLVISRMGAPIKSAVMKVQDDKKILATGNLFVIELDTDKVNPYYLDAYINSEEGTKALSKILVGAVQPSISISELKNLNVPLPSLEVQNNVAKEYQKALQDVQKLNKELKEAKRKLKNIFKLC